MWRLRIMDHIAGKIYFEYEFLSIEMLMKFIQMNDIYNTERCKYMITRDEEELPFADPLGE